MDRRMIGNIQQNLTRAVHAPHAAAYPAPKTPAKPNNTMQIGQYQIRVGIDHEHATFNQKPASSNMVNLQYNSPIGLYSNASLKDELNNKVK